MHVHPEKSVKWTPENVLFVLYINYWALEGSKFSLLLTYLTFLYLQLPCNNLLTESHNTVYYLICCKKATIPNNIIFVSFNILRNPILKLFLVWEN